MGKELASKDACVYIIDVSPSMLQPMNCDGGGGGGGGGGGDASEPVLSSISGGFISNLADDKIPQQKQTSRLACAIHAVQHMIAESMLLSKTNEVGIILFGTPTTEHHLANDGEEGAAGLLKNITEFFPATNLVRPDATLLKKLGKIATEGGYYPGGEEGSEKRKGEGGNDNNEEDFDAPQSPKSVPGNFVDSLLVAASAIFNRTKNKQYNRKIFMLTDAENRVTLDNNLTHRVLNNLLNLECRFTVIGLDFKSEASFVGGIEKVKREAKDVDDEEGGDDEDEDDEDEDDEDEDDEDEEDDEEDYVPTPAEIKSENEKLLISIARQTLGSVIAASSLIQIMRSFGGKRIPRSMKRKLSLKIGPGVTLDASFANFVTRANLKTLKKRAFEMDKDGNFVRDDWTGDKIGVEFSTDHSLRDAAEPNIEVPYTNRMKAYRYGSDFVPLNAFDEYEIKMHSDISMAVFGYIPNDEIPRGSFIDSAYAITGGESERSKLAISALAQGLEELKQAAVVRFVKTKDGDPVIGVLLPLSSDKNRSSFDIYRDGGGGGGRERGRGRGGEGGC